MGVPGLGVPGLGVLAGLGVPGLGVPGRAAIPKAAPSRRETPISACHKPRRSSAKTDKTRTTPRIPGQPSFNGTKQYERV